MPDISYDTIEIGKQHGPWKYPLRDRIARYLEAIENAHPWHLERSPWGPPVAPPSLLGTAAIRFLDQIGPVPPGTLHVKQEIETAAALRLDRQPIGYGQFTEKYERRGRRWFVFDTRWRDETGLIIGRSRITMAFPGDPTAPGQKARGNTQNGERRGELSPVVRKLTQDKMTAYSEDSANALRGTSIHVQPAAAKKAGFDTTLAQGLMGADYISELIEGELGKEWYENAKLSLAFLLPVFNGDTLTVNGRLSGEVEEGAIVRRTYEVWCENQRGETTTAGTASVLARRSPS